MAASLSSVSSSTAIKWAVGSWSLFMAENVILSENRTQLIQYLGDDNYHIFYGTCSSVAVGSILYAYRYKIRGVGPVAIGVSSISARIASFVLSAVGLGMASQALPKLQIPIHYYSTSSTNANNESSSLPVVIPNHPTHTTTGQWKVRCPFDFSDKYSQTAASQNIDSSSAPIMIQGLDRITRHPGLWAFACLGVGNALLVHTLPTQIWYSMPLAVALVGGYHTDSRYRRGLGGYLSSAMENQTSFIPFWAILSGKQGEVMNVLRNYWKDEFKGLNASVGVGIAALWVLKRSR